MKITLSELKTIVGDVVSEAKKKKVPKKDPKAPGEIDPGQGSVPRPPEYKYAEAFDFSHPLGANNLYRQQGAANFGPYTGAAATIDDRKGVHHSTVESLIPEDSAWKPFADVNESVAAPKGSVWNEAVLHWYDSAARGLGTPGAIQEKKLGFKKLANKLAHKKGVTDPKGLAASIGRKKFGAKKFQKMASAGKK